VYRRILYAAAALVCSLTHPACEYVEPGSEVMSQPHGHDMFYPGPAFAARLAHELAEQTRLVWATGTHTSQPVPIMAMGPAMYARGVQGYGHNTDIAHILFAALEGRPMVSRDE
jgi:hypothetical protein